MSTARVISVKILRRRGLGNCDVRILTVQCPYGPHTHTHGGGDAARSVVLGQRSPHCHVRHEYRLALAPGVDPNPEGIPE
jgi:hypothetical protein